MSAAVPRPPLVPRVLLRMMLPASIREEVLGDLTEEFRSQCATAPRWRAHVWYWQQVFSRDLFHLRREHRLPTHHQRMLGSHITMDLRYAIRRAFQAPVFSSIVVLLLAMGIGANTAIFSVVKRVLIEPLPYADPDRLVLLWNRLESTGADRVPISRSDVADFRELAQSVEGFAATDRPTDAILTGSVSPTYVTLGRVTQNFFSLLGVSAALGRTFNASEDWVPAGADSNTVEPLVMSHGLWQRAFGSDPSIVGRLVKVNGISGVVIGVMPVGFRLRLPSDVPLSGDADIWALLALEDNRGVRDDQRIRDQDSDDTGAVIGRVRSGVPIGRVQGDMDAIAGNMRDRFQYYANVGLHIDVYPMQDDVASTTQPLLTTLVVTVGFVLVIVCVNLANLMLMRADGRRQEMALRTALGATRWRLRLQDFVEAVLLATVGGILGVVVAWAGVAGLDRLWPPSLPLGGSLSIDPGVLLFSAVLTTAVAIVFGVIPSFIRPETQRQDLSTRGAAVNRVQGLLVGTEIALSMTLVVGAGLMVRTLVELHRADLGFNPDGVVTFDLTLRNGDRYGGPAARSRLVRQLEENLQNVPGVQSVALIGRLPLSGRAWTNQYGREGQGYDEWGGNEANFRMITEDYFDVMQTRVVWGRTFTRQDDAQDVRVAIIDETLANTIAPQGAAIGRRIGFPLDGERVWAEIVGVVAAIRQDNLRAVGRETIYVPYRHEASRDVSMVVRADVDPLSLAPAIREAMAPLDPDLPIHNIRTMSAYVADAGRPVSFALVLLGVFASVAVFLAAVGLYGVIAYFVSRRTREIGVRMALGADPERVIFGVLRRGMVVAGGGIGVGAILAMYTSRGVRELVYAVPLLDLRTYLFATGLLLVVTLLASSVPARRAVRIDPVACLRDD